MLRKWIENYYFEKTYEMFSKEISPSFFWHLANTDKQLKNRTKTKCFWESKLLSQIVNKMVYWFHETVQVLNSHQVNTFDES